MAVDGLGAVIFQIMIIILLGLAALIGLAALYALIEIIKGNRKLGFIVFLGLILSLIIWKTTSNLGLFFLYMMLIIGTIVIRLILKLISHSL